MKRPSDSLRPVGWERVEADWWLEIRSTLEATGVPWLEGAARMDLRWWAGQARATKDSPHPIQVPPYRFFSESWHWSERRTRKLMAEEHSWKDPHWEEVSEESASKLGGAELAQERRKSGAKPAQDETVERQESNETGAELAQERRKTGAEVIDTRDLSSPNTVHRSQNTDSLSPSSLSTEQLPRKAEREQSPVSEELKKEQEDSESLSLYQLFGPATASALTRAGISDVTALTKLTARQTRMLKGIGEGNAGAIRLRLQAMGLDFAEEGRVAASTGPPGPPEIRTVKKRRFDEDPQPARQAHGG